MKVYLKFLFVNVLIILMLFTILEISIRIFFPQIQLPGTEKTLFEDCVYYDSPGLVPNSKGSSNGIIKFVNNNRFWKFNPVNKNVKNKILFLGDSVTMGIGVESDSTFAGILNSSLNEYEIYNLALIGYSNKDYKNIVKKIFTEDSNNYKFTSVILFWCLNDIYSDYSLNDKIELNQSSFLNQFLILLRNNFKFYHFVKNIFFDRAKSYFLYDDKFYSENNSQFKSAIKNVNEIKKILDEFKVNFTVVTLPYEYQLRNKNFVNIKPQITLFNSLKSNGINSVDISKMISKNNFNSNDYYLYKDGIHFSKFGHRIISKILLNSQIFFQNQ